MNPDKNKHYALLYISVAFVYVVGSLRIGIIDIDASLYAEMSREMFRSGNYFIFLNRGVDPYLDKPPLVFWSAVLSYALFGVNHFAYRLPTLLTTVLGAYSVYGFTRLYYGKEAGLSASALLVTCQAWFLINHDVRTDTMLANFVMFGTWQLALWLSKKKRISFILAFTGFGFAILAKGPIGLMAPVVAFLTEFIYKRQWKQLLSPVWLAGALISGILILPMLYSLYKQFGPYGIEFTLWTQSFGRILGQNYWSDSSGPLFFVHTFLWSFLPWSILAIFATAWSLRRIISKRKQPREVPEAITTGGFIITFVILSMSSYKLPHYIYVVFPYIAVISGAFLSKIKEYRTSWPRILQYIQPFIAVAMILPGFLLVIFFFPDAKVFLYLFLILLAALAARIALFRPGIFRLVFWLPAIAVTGTNLVLNVHVYPSLLQYQPGDQIAEFIEDKEIGTDDVFLYGVHSPAMDFYMQATPPRINLRKMERLASQREELWVITDEPGLDRIRSFRTVQAEVVGSFRHYPIQILTLKFLNPSTRHEVTGTWHVVRIYYFGGEF